MEKIDLTKCNNCRFKAKIDGIVTTGIVSAKDGLNAFLKNEQGYNVGCLTGAGLVDSDNRLITDFEIVPRDPETYQDWQVGDAICNSDGKAADGRIIFRSGEFVAADIYGCVCYTCQELFDINYRLVLTDIEKQIIEERERAKLRAFKSEIKSEIKSGHQFRKGEPVLVRGYEFHRWIIAAYVDKDKLGFIANAGVSVIHWKYCLPYNERTMHLLGTTEDYREEQA